MVSYLARWDQANNTDTGISITAVTWPIRLAQISFWTAAGSITFNSYRYDGGSASGGRSAPVVALRQGAPAATATSRLGVLSFTGTRRTLGAAFIGLGQQHVPSGTTTTIVLTGATAQISLPLTTVIQPGSTFSVIAGGAINPFFNSSTGCEIYFEELRLQGGY